MSTENSKPDNNGKKRLAPVIVLKEEPNTFRRYMILMLPSLFGSVVFHAVLVAAFIAYVMWQTEPPAVAKQVQKEEAVTADPPRDDPKETFNVTDVDPSPDPAERDTNINFAVDRIAEVSVPGTVIPDQAVGIKDGDKTAPPVSLPAPGGFGSGGQGGAIEISSGMGNSNAIGEVGGYGPKGVPLQGSFFGRSGATREYALRNGGGTDASEAAVALGLKWLIRQQMTDGRWSLTGNEGSNDIAGTALGLLPLLAAGKTHKPAKDNAYDKNIDKALKFLVRSQNPKTGFFGGTMYSHGLASIAMCEAYGLSQDPALRKPAQMAINLIVNVQHEGGGWRYGPAKTPGDMSVAGWQIMAVKSAQMAGLDVPTLTVTRAKNFLDSCRGPTEGYGYVAGSGSTPRMTVVGLLCRQYMQNWGPSRPEMIKAINTYVKTQSPAKQDVYFYYYATQVMHHFGGEAWKAWNDVMRDSLVKKQDKTSGANQGSWAPDGDPFGRTGGRLMITSLNLLTLEVYYRYLPLYYRDAGYKMEKDGAVQKAF